MTNKKLMKNIIENLHTINLRSFSELSQQIDGVLKSYDNYSADAATIESVGNELLFLTENLSFDCAFLSSSEKAAIKGKDIYLSDYRKTKAGRERYKIIRKGLYSGAEQEEYIKRYKKCVVSEADGVYGIMKYSLVILSLLNYDIEKMQENDDEYCSDLRNSIYDTLVSLYNALCGQVHSYLKLYQKDKYEFYHDFIRCICTLLHLVIKETKL